MSAAKLGSMALAGLLASCAGYHAAGLVQSGRRALLISDSDSALSYFQQAALIDPGYIFEYELFREGVWTYVGRAQYKSGKLAEARESLERALSVYPDDHLARLYLGLTRARAGEVSAAIGMIERALRDLHAWLEYTTYSNPFEDYWDPFREIRSEIERNLMAISGKDVDPEKLVANAEWIGRTIEDEVDRVRDDRRRRLRDRRFPGSRVFLEGRIGF
ncbi:MAG TPA: tetratricopeptide repeat protein [candidate division Zixibacteria bacterium]|nr:tetratricopeptide repeat protein [candidate division Zixibacteria bacterium]